MCGGCFIFVIFVVKKLNVEVIYEIFIYYKIVFDMYCKYMLLKKDKIIYFFSLFF